ncbi:MAG: DUF1223 domain-containing protein [Gammaproteobacteria bacterium]
MIIRITCLLLLLIPGGASAADIQLDSGPRQVTLLELYTSQGCSSCPPAERWLNEYIDSDDLWNSVVPVALHVDYWDYIGWKDIFASKEHAQRQRDYARAGKTRTVYTPGFFVNGRDWRGWTLRLKPGRSRSEPGNLSARIAGDRLSASFPVADKPVDLHVALLGFGIETQVGRGENRGRTLAQEFVVLEHNMYRSASGSWEVTMPAARHATVKSYGIALWVSEPGNPAPLQATGGWLP